MKGIAIMKKNFLFFGYVLLLIMIQPIIASKKVLVVVDRFPWYTKNIITHQIKSLIDAGFHVAVYSKVRPRESALLEQQKINLKIYYETIPQNLNSYDLIICQYGHLGKEFIDIKLKRNLKARLITCFRGHDITASSRLSEGYYDKLFKYGDLFFPVCAYYKYRLELLGCDPSKIAVVYSGIETEIFTDLEHVYTKLPENYESYQFHGFQSPKVSNMQLELR